MRYQYSNDTGLLSLITRWYIYVNGLKTETAVPPDTSPRENAAKYRGPPFLFGIGTDFSNDNLSTCIQKGHVGVLYRYSITLSRLFALSSHNLKSWSVWNVPCSWNNHSQFSLSQHQCRTSTSIYIKLFNTPNIPPSVDMDLSGQEDSLHSMPGCPTMVSPEIRWEFKTHIRNFSVLVLSNNLLK